MLYEEAPRFVPYLVCTCWLGLRPSEAQRVRWELFDWERGSLFCDLTVAKKLEQERYVPINATARVQLERWLKAQGLWAKAQRGEKWFALPESDKSRPPA